MAENETLDIHCSSRWRKPLEALRRRAPAEEVAELLRESLAASWESIRRQFKKGGYSLEQILDAAIAGDKAFLDQAYRDLHYHKFVNLIRVSVGFMENREQVMERAIRHQLRTATQQIRNVLAQDPSFRSVAEASEVTASAFGAIQQDCAAYARGFVENPRAAKQKLCSSKVAHDPRDPSTQTAILGLSIIATGQAGSGARS